MCGVRCEVCGVWCKRRVFSHLGGSRRPIGAIKET